MEYRRFLAPSLCALGALAITASVFLLDRQRSGVLDAAAALRWARQVASHAEGLAFQARTQEESDPVGWAANLLNQGQEPRAVRVLKTQIEGSQAQESFFVDHANSALEYVKRLSAEDSMGIRVQVPIPYSGFLGTRSRLASDVSVLGFFALLLGLLLASWRAIAVSRGRTRDLTQNERLRSGVADWIPRAKKLLTQLGIHVREMVREARNLAESTAHSRDKVIDLREKMRAGVQDTHESVLSLKEAEQASMRIKVLTLRTLEEVSKEDGDPRAVKRSLELIRDLSIQAHRGAQTGGAAVGRLEVAVKPWLSQVEEACTAFEDTSRAGLALDGHIRKSTETITQHANQLQLLAKTGTPPPRKAAPSGRPGRVPG